jgi:hypothetical protein
VRLAQHGALLAQVIEAKHGATCRWWEEFSANHSPAFRGGEGVLFIHTIWFGYGWLAV